ncbi:MULTISPECIES: hypothetical protein [unclassified Bradyrhizobium]|uniref:hypothetical protein n=1 Tax=unclassified Bradyrhizobium TaxID=2631580 RepID=UPI001FF9BC0A|nr:MULTISPECIES: hypothetical protein [unclassified Bradyrhizobium]MCK1711253.1 hypothetical protein [Bradyrhizobium sp. 143]MCK1726687.1 hypothetical protein [Bradyrhizobium sp. 142]
MRVAAGILGPPVDSKLRLAQIGQGYASGSSPRHLPGGRDQILPARGIDDNGKTESELPKGLRLIVDLAFRLARFRPERFQLVDWHQDRREIVPNRVCANWCLLQLDDRQLRAGRMRIRKTSSGCQLPPTAPEPDGLCHELADRGLDDRGIAHVQEFEHEVTRGGLRPPLRLGFDARIVGESAAIIFQQIGEPHDRVFHGASGHRAAALLALLKGGAERKLEALRDLNRESELSDTAAFGRKVDFSRFGRPPILNCDSRFKKRE